MADRQVKVVLEACKGDKVYQRTTFEQFFDDKETQLSEQVPLFTAVADTVKKVMGEMD